MRVFGFGKNKEKQMSCECSGAVSGDKTCFESEKGCTCGDDGCNIKVLGAGCRSCHEQLENVEKAVAKMQIDAQVEYITDMQKIMEYGVMSMPAIVVDEKVVAMGKVLKADQVEELFKKCMKNLR